MVFTRDRGKVPTMAKGVQRITSKNVGHLEPGYRISVMIAWSQGMEKLASAKMLEPFLELRNTQGGSSLLAYVLELVEESTHDHHPDPWIYDHLVTVLRQLNQSFVQTSGSVGDRERLWVRIFSLQILSHIGNLAPLGQCLTCQKPLRGNVASHPSDYGFVHADHQLPSSHPVPQDVYELLLSLHVLPLQEFARVPLEHAPLRETIPYCDDMIHGALQHQLQSASFV